MKTVNIALSSELNEFVQSEAARAGCKDTGDYILSLIREEQKRMEEARLETMLLDGINSGESTGMTKEDWDARKQRLYARHGKP